MMKRLVRALYFFSLLAGFLQQEVKGQTQIGGIINGYFQVTQLFNADSSNVDSVRVSDNSGISPGDYLMIMQMQAPDYVIQYGLESTYAGKYEILRVASVPASNIVVFSSPLSNYYESKSDSYIKYSLPGKIQLIKIPYYTNDTVQVNSTLTCKAWDGATGGVLVLMARNLVDLHADIDVSGKGYRGSKGTAWSNCLSFASEIFVQELDPQADSVGIKGEGVVMPGDSADYRGVSGAPTSGINNCAGGGFGIDAGGGGGANGGAGGDGSYQNCVTNKIKAYGAKAHKYSNDTTGFKVFMGGGGGGGLFSAGKNSEQGGNGGGIIFVIARSLQGNSHYIRSDGVSVTATSTGGAGGGGAGGAIMLNVSSYKDTTCIVSAKGGKGGSGLSGSLIKGGGGGGGAGYIWYVKPLSGKFVTQLDGGSGGGGAAAGGTSTASPTLVLVGRGLLNNYYDPGSQIICKGDTAKKIWASKPSGGFGNFTFHWIRKKAGESKYSDAPGVNNDTLYSPGPLDTTSYFRRIVYSMDPVTFQVLSDSSDNNDYIVYVYPSIGNYQLSGTDTICSGLNKLMSGSAASGGYKTNLYKWQWSTNSGPYAALPDTTRSYTSPILNENTKIVYHYRRISYSDFGFGYDPHACSKVSDAVDLTVFPVISGNTLDSYSDTVICQGLQAYTSAGKPTGGDGVNYYYQWHTSSPDSLLLVGGSQNRNLLSNILPNQFLNANDTLLFWREVKVLSGNDIVCQSFTPARRIIVPPGIRNNSILHDTIVCQNAPTMLYQGTIPAGGRAGDYAYTWQQSADSSNWQVLSGNAKDWMPPVYTLGNKTWWYRRVVESAEQKTCKDTANIRVFVQPEIQNNNIWPEDRDTLLCYGDIRDSIHGSAVLSGGDGLQYHFVWQKIQAGNTSTLGGDSINLASSEKMLDSTIYRRIARSGTCLDTALALVNVLPLIRQYSLIADTTVCINTSPVALNVGTPAGGDGSYSYQWWKLVGNLPDSLVSVEESFQPRPEIMNSTIQYKRLVLSPSNSNVCHAEDSVTLAVWNRPTGAVDFLHDLSDTVCERDANIRFPIALTGKAPFVFRLDRNYNGLITRAETLEWSINGDTSLSDQPHPDYGDSLVQYTYHPVYLRDAHLCEARIDSSELTDTSFILNIRKIPEISAFTNFVANCTESASLYATYDVGKPAWSFINPTDTFSRVITSDALKVPFVISRPATDDTTACFNGWVSLLVDNGGCTEHDSANVKLFRNLDKLPVLIVNPDSTLFYPVADILQTIPINPAYEKGVWGSLENLPEVAHEYDTLWVFNLYKSDFGKHTYTWTLSNEQCTRTDTVVRTYLNIKMYDGFSPGGIYNPYLVCEGISNIDQYELTIINRLGQVVYQYSRSNRSVKPYPADVEAVWDGSNQNGEPMPDGTYYYILKVNGVFYKKDKMAGHYIVLRRSQ